MICRPSCEGDQYAGAVLRPVIAEISGCFYTTRGRRQAVLPCHTFCPWSWSCSLDGHPRRDLPTFSDLRLGNGKFRRQKTHTRTHVRTLWVSRIFLQISRSMLIIFPKYFFNLLDIYLTTSCLLTDVICIRGSKTEDGLYLVGWNCRGSVEIQVRQHLDASRPNA